MINPLDEQPQNYEQNHYEAGFLSNPRITVNY